MTSDGRALIEFVKNLTTLRHRLPVLRRGRFIIGEYNEALDVTDARWLSPDGTEFAVNLVPHTLAASNLGALKGGDRVNLEVDLLARYIERLHSVRES